MATAYKVVTGELQSPQLPNRPWQPGEEVICDDDRAGFGLYVWAELESARTYAQLDRRGSKWRANGASIVEVEYDLGDVIRRGSRPDGANAHLVLRRCTVARMVEP
jgi:hypothetical protein